MKFNKIQLCLDLSDIDTTLVKYAVFLANKAAIEKIYLFHNIRYDFLESVDFSSSEVSQLKSVVAKKIQKRFEHLFQVTGKTYEVVVEDDNSTTNAIMNFKQQNNIDLLVMGKKNEEDGAGIIPQKIMSIDKQTTPLLLIPEKAKLRFDHQLAAIDLAPSSKKLLNASSELEKILDIETTYLHVYKLPVTYFPYIEEENDVIQKDIRKRAERKFSAFLKSTDITSNSWQLQLKKGVNVTKTIVNYANANEVDLILLGRIGKTNLLGNKLGGVARRFLATSLSQVLLIV